MTEGTMDDFHNCGVDGHTQRVKSGLLFCLYHWRRVSRVTQQRVYATYREHTDNPTLDTVRDYRAAVAQATAEASAAQRV